MDEAEHVRARLLACNEKPCLTAGDLARHKPFGASGIRGPLVKHTISVEKTREFRDIPKIRLSDPQHHTYYDCPAE